MVRHASSSPALYCFSCRLVSFPLTHFFISLFSHPLVQLSLTSFSPLSLSTLVATFEREYHVDFAIGRGGFGTVYAGVRRRDQLPVAIKHVFLDRISKWDTLNGHRVPLEISLLNRVSCVPGAIKLIDWFERHDSFIIIMEKPDQSKDLFDYISERSVLDENTARFFFRQIVETLIQCYKLGVHHGDLKDENICVL